MSAVLIRLVLAINQILLQKFTANLDHGFKLRPGQGVGYAHPRRRQFRRRNSSRLLGTKVPKESNPLQFPALLWRRSADSYLYSSYTVRGAEEYP